MGPASFDYLEQSSRFDVVEAFIRAWTDQDIERCLAFCAPNVRYSDNIGDVIKPYKGVWQGKQQFGRIMQTAVKHWTNFVVQPKLLKGRVEDPALVQCRIEFVILHKDSREFMFGSNRFVARVEGGLITEIQVFHDAPMFLAFLRLIGSKREKSIGAKACLVDDAV